MLGGKNLRFHDTKQGYANPAGRRSRLRTEQRPYQNRDATAVSEPSRDRKGVVSRKGAVTVHQRR